MLNSYTSVTRKPMVSLDIRQLECLDPPIVLRVHWQKNCASHSSRKQIIWRLKKLHTCAFVAAAFVYVRKRLFDVQHSFFAPNMLLMTKQESNKNIETLDCARTQDERSRQLCLDIDYAQKVVHSMILVVWRLATRTKACSRRHQATSTRALLTHAHSTHTRLTAEH